ncbi:MAG: indole-3-glycerol phosphate synthase TrpC [Dehalococcoidales bacterium]|nr:indole-3-glycerol phosphate synthase TrpC [Dehalococcoidales bacterium]
MVNHVLNMIIADKREELGVRKLEMPLSALKERIAQRRVPLDFGSVINRSRIQLIAEVKQSSPSRGVLCNDFSPVGLANEYVAGGAAAISVLTEANYFGGSIDHLAAISMEVNLPLLRKDFIFDPYQIYESAAYGADALLLIVGVLSQRQLDELLSLSHRLSMECLVEVHNEAEIERALKAKARVIGINNRDLSNFIVDINTTCRLRPLLPEPIIVVSESGINRRLDVERLEKCGVDAILVGEALVTADDVEGKIKELML